MICEALERRTLCSGGVLRSITTDFGGTETIDAMVVERNGRVVVLGENGQRGGLNQAFLVRYTPAGKLDRTFGDQGRVVGLFADFPLASCLAIDSAGRVIVAGHGDPAQGLITDIAISRFDSRGRVDHTFGSNGELLTEMNQPVDARAVAVDGAGNIVVAGSLATVVGPHATATTGFVFRCHRNGVADSTFNANGVQTFSFGKNRNTATAIAFDGRGRITIGGNDNDGNLFDSGTQALGLCRLNRNGSFDNSFGVAGRLDFLPGENATVQGMRLLANGRIEVAGSTTAGDINGATHMVLARFLSNGTADSRFGATGAAYTVTTTPESVAAIGLAIDGAGRTYVGGYINNGFNDSGQPDTGAMVLARFDANGKPDAKFGSSGELVTTVTSSEFIDTRAEGIGIQPGGIIVVGGNSGPDVVNQNISLVFYSPLLRS